MIGLVLVMHGELAAAFHAALEHVVGPQHQIVTLSVSPQDNVEIRMPDIEAAIAEVDKGEGAVIVTDVFGGTPCRIATATLDRDQVHVVAGVNLPMLIKLARVRQSASLAEVVDRAREAGQVHYYCETSAEPDMLETGIWTSQRRTVSADVEIVNVKGLHARASMKFVKLAERFDANIRVSRAGETVGGTSIMGLLMLGAAQGAMITVTASGREADQAVAQLSKLVANGFDEDERDSAINKEAGEKS